MKTSKPNIKYASTHCAYKKTEIGMILEGLEVVILMLFFSKIEVRQNRKKYVFLTYNYFSQ